MVSMPLVGFLIHRFGSRRVIGGGLMLCLALPLLAIAPSMTTLALGLVYFGVALGMVAGLLLLTAASAGLAEA